MNGQCKHYTSSYVIKISNSNKILSDVEASLVGVTWNCRVVLVVG